MLFCMIHACNIDLYIFRTDNNLDDIELSKFYLHFIFETVYLTHMIFLSLLCSII